MDDLIDSAGKARATEQHEAALRAGFDGSQTAYAVGTIVNQTGIDNADHSRAEWEAMPGAVEVADRVIGQIRGENRRVYEAIARDCRMMPWGVSGEFHHTTEGRLIGAPTDRAFEAICRQVIDGGFAPYLLKCPIDLRAQNMNHWLSQAVTPKRGTPKELNFWLRDGQTTPEIFSAFGGRYQPFGGDQVLDAAISRLPAGAKGDARYDGYNGRLDAILHSNVPGSQYVAGEYFQAMVRLRWADDGSGSIRVDVGVIRNLCRNLIILAHRKQRVLTRRHLGTVDAIQTSVNQALETAQEKLAYFSNAWDSANADNLLEKYNMDDMTAVFRGLVYNGHVAVPGMRADAIVDMLVSAWEREPGYSKAAVINAITRAAHTTEFSAGSWAQDQLEETAGDLLYAKVWNVAYEE